MNRINVRNYRATYLVVTIVVLFGINLWWNGRTADNVKTQVARAESVAIASAIRRDDLKWCGALTILTMYPAAKPADPKANPSREESYQFYSALVTLKSQQGCAAP